MYTEIFKIKTPHDEVNSCRYDEVSTSNAIFCNKIFEGWCYKQVKLENGDVITYVQKPLANEETQSVERTLHAIRSESRLNENSIMVTSFTVECEDFSWMLTDIGRVNCQCDLQLNVFLDRTADRFYANKHPNGVDYQYLFGNPVRIYFSLLNKNKETIEDGVKFIAPYAKDPHLGYIDLTEGTIHEEDKLSFGYMNIDFSNLTIKDKNIQSYIRTIVQGYFLSVRYLFEKIYLPNNDKI